MTFLGGCFIWQVSPGKFYKWELDTAGEPRPQPTRGFSAIQSNHRHQSTHQQQNATQDWVSTTYSDTLVAKLNQLCRLVSSCDICEWWIPQIITTVIVVCPKTLVARLNHLHWLISSCDVYELWIPQFLQQQLLLAPKTPDCEVQSSLLIYFVLWCLWMVNSTDSYNSDWCFAPTPSLRSWIISAEFFLWCMWMLNSAYSYNSDCCFSPHRLQGNPICTGQALVNAEPTLCNGTVTTEATNWTSPLLSSNTCTNNCDNTHVLNPESCLCGFPLIIGLEIRSPPWTNINNITLWNSLHDQTVTQLGLQSTQVWVREAYFTGSKRARADIYFFPVSGESLDLDTQLYIIAAFTGQKVHYDNLFKPSLIVLVIRPPGDDSMMVIFG